MSMDQNLNALMKEAQKMQQKMQEAQNQLGQLKVVGESGGGLVKIEMNGRHDVTKVTITPSLMSGEVEILEDLIQAACNAGARKIEEASKQKISQLTAGLNLPADFLKDDKE